MLIIDPTRTNDESERRECRDENSLPRARKFAATKVELIDRSADVDSRGSTTRLPYDPHGRSIATAALNLYREPSRNGDNVRQHVASMFACHLAGFVYLRSTNACSRAPAKLRSVMAIQHLLLKQSQPRQKTPIDYIRGYREMPPRPPPGSFLVFPPSLSRHDAYIRPWARVYTYRMSHNRRRSSPGYAFNRPLKSISLPAGISRDSIFLTVSRHRASPQLRLELEPVENVDACVRRDVTAN